MSGEVLDNLGREGSAETRNGTTLSDMSVRWLNRAQLQAARKYNILFKTSTATTVADVQTYTFPATLRSLYSLRLENGIESRKLTCIMPWDFDKAVSKPDEDFTSTPTYYIPYKATNEFELYRIPDDTYTLRLRYSMWPADLALDASTSSYQVAGIDADDATIALATSYGYAYLQELVDATKWREAGWMLWKMISDATRDIFPDWAPREMGFSIYDSQELPGEYYNNPFVLRGP